MKLRALTLILFAACAQNYSPSSQTKNTADAVDAGFETPPADSEATVDPGDSGAAARALVEADIIQLNDGKLYALSRSGTLSVVDVSKPASLTLLGQTTLIGTPFEMYLRGTQLVVMKDGASQASILLVDASTPSDIKTTATVDIAGQIADSRLLGEVLYLGTYESDRTLVTSFALSDLHQLDQKEFKSSAVGTDSNVWGREFKRSIYANNKRLYIGGHTEVDPKYWDTEKQVTEGIIDVLDITDPNGSLQNVVRIQVAGAILSRWQLDERDGILRVISQTGAGRTNAGLGDPRVVTLQITDAQPAGFHQIGGMSLIMPRQEGLRSARFDADRVYAVTFAETDPLFIVDLSDPTKPKQLGELHMPGFIYHIEPFGDRLITLGVDASDNEGSLNVSLIDVSSADHPSLIKRVAFAPNRYTNFDIVDREIAEDQDRIQKAFRVIENGLIAVPFSGSGTCANTGGGVQLIDWKDNTISKRALLQVAGNPRRAFKNGNEIVAVSDSNVRSFALSSGAQTADLTIGACLPTGEHPINGNWEGGDTMGDDTMGYDRHRVGCSQSGGVWYVLILLAFLARSGIRVVRAQRTVVCP